jgi:hypothetical protein
MQGLDGYAGEYPFNIGHPGMEQAHVRAESLFRAGNTFHFGDFHPYGLGQRFKTIASNTNN